MGLVVLASAWGRISYNFLFFFAALQAVPRSVIEAAAIDGHIFGAVFYNCVATDFTNHVLFTCGERCLSF